MYPLAVAAGRRTMGCWLHMSEAAGVVKTGLEVRLKGYLAGLPPQQTVEQGRSVQCGPLLIAGQKVRQGDPYAGSGELRPEYVGVGQIRLLGVILCGGRNGEMPPSSWSSRAAKMLGASNRGRQHQSTEPSVAIRAAVMVFPTRP